MKKQGIFRVIVFVAFILSVSIACGAVTGTTDPPTPQPAQQQPTPVPQQSVQQPSPQPVQQDTPEPVSVSGTVTFTDEDKLYSIEVPSDWIYSQSTGEYYYIDQFKSPDEQALVENIVYDEGTAFSGGINGKFALYLLNTFYSSTGKEGDIRVSDDSIQKDGSERLTWASKGGGYSGISFFEVRNRTTFLMLTIEWMKGAEEQHRSTLEQVVSTYSIP